VCLNRQIFFALEHMICRQNQILRIDDATCWTPLASIYKYQSGANMLNGICHLI